MRLMIEWWGQLLKVVGGIAGLAVCGYQLVRYLFTRMLRSSKMMGDEGAKPLDEGTERDTT